MSMGVVDIVTKARMAAALAEHEQVLEAREGTCGRRGTELKCRAIHVCKLRWNYGTSGEWGSEGLVNVVGITVGPGRK